MSPLRYSPLLLIMLGLVAWGLFHAVGAFGAYTLNYDMRRAAVVLVCTAGYLGFWGLMLWNRRRRLRRTTLPKSDIAPQ